MNSLPIHYRCRSAKLAMMQHRHSHILLLTIFQLGLTMSGPAEASDTFPRLTTSQPPLSGNSGLIAPKSKDLSSSAWKLVRSKGRKEGEEFVSIMKTAELLKSDPDFVGLMLRCAPGSKVDFLVVIVSPLPPRSRPQVTVSDGGKTLSFEGKMAAGGAAVALPDEASSLASGPWQAAPRLSVVIKDSEIEIKGEVEMTGFGAAYGNLLGNCFQ